MTADQKVPYFQEAISKCRTYLWRRRGLRPAYFNPYKNNFGEGVAEALGKNPWFLQDLEKSISADPTGIFIIASRIPKSSFSSGDEQDEQIALGSFISPIDGIRTIIALNPSCSCSVNAFNEIWKTRRRGEKYVPITVDPENFDNLRQRALRFASNDSGLFNFDSHSMDPGSYLLLAMQGYLNNEDHRRVQIDSSIESTTRGTKRKISTSPVVM